MGVDPSRAKNLGERIGHEFRDLDRLERALTHASARDKGGSDYERLEFLGDRVLGLTVAEMLFRHFPKAREGELSVRLNALVNGQTLAEVGNDIGISEFIITGSDVKSLKGRKGTNVRADVMEALIAAIYLEGGLDAARNVIQRHWEPRAEGVARVRRDAKTELQEWAHQVVGDLPVYKIANRIGPDHDPMFTVSVMVGGKLPEEAVGRSKREAEQAAAEKLLLREGVWKSPSES